MYLLGLLYVLQLTILIDYLIHFYVDIKVLKFYQLVIIFFILSIFYILILYSTQNILFTFLLLLILASLILIFYIDYKKMIIPDSLNIFIGLISILLIILSIFKKIPLFINSYLDIIASLIFIIFVSLIIILIKVFKKKEVMGFGDIKLLFALGIYLGLINILIIIFLSSLISIISEGIIYKFKRKMFPFGPYIVIATIILLLFLLLSPFFLINFTWI